MTPEAWEDLALRLRGGMHGTRYGTGDYAVLSIARMVALDHAGYDGVMTVDGEWKEDRRELSRAKNGATP